MLYFIANVGIDRTATKQNKSSLEFDFARFSLVFTFIAHVRAPVPTEHADRMPQTIHAAYSHTGKTHKRRAAGRLAAAAAAAVGASYLCNVQHLM